MATWTKNQIDRIQTALAEQRLAVFFGSGISVSSGLPDWNGLIDAMTMILKNHKIYSSALHRGVKPLARQYPLGVLDYLRDTDKEAFDESFRRLFPNDRRVYQSTEEGKLISRFKTNLFVTTNYDYCFQRSFAEIRPSEALQTLYDSAIQVNALTTPIEPSLFQVHGVAENSVSQLVLTESQYDSAYRNNSVLPSFLERLFENFLVLFIGFGFNDSDINRVLSRSNAFGAAQAQFKHIGIFGTTKNKSGRITLEDYARKRWNTEAIFYKVHDRSKSRDHSNLKKLISELHQYIGSTPIQMAALTTYEIDPSAMANPPVSSR